MAARDPMTDPVVPAIGLSTDEPLEILRYAHASVEAGIATALVTLVEIHGGSARPLGSQMVVRADGLYCGFVSGGCTENAVAAEALEALQNGHDRFLRLGEGSRFFDIVLPCGGGINLAIHRLRSVKELEEVIGELELRRGTALRYSPASERLSVDRRFRGVSQWDREDFVIAYQPTTRLLVFGRSIEATATADAARAAGIDIHLVDGQMTASSLKSLIDPFTAVALLDHDLDREIPHLRLVLDSRAFYIGALGSLRTHGRRIKALADDGYSEADIDRIKAPIGIFGKAKSASSLALSIVADVVAARMSAKFQT
ncbi:XdhC family protein [Rhizobium azibense]|uniref:Xanthine dehydrogenase accessory factor n=1 Tax=Rhizobium azibense TaxID=1136135 RepID=A0A4R3RI94_9HYPH|nr:XdhC family protein [Rhizobium azibense]TCU34851.1 xanthine dehydrogenase accessory factor [Rhizobium azibense]